MKSYGSRSSSRSYHRAESPQRGGGGGVDEEECSVRTEQSRDTRSTRWMDDESYNTYYSDASMRKRRNKKLSFLTFVCHDETNNNNNNSNEVRDDEDEEPAETEGVGGMHTIPDEEDEDDDIVDKPKETDTGKIQPSNFHHQPPKGGHGRNVLKPGFAMGGVAREYANLMSNTASAPLKLNSSSSSGCSGDEDGSSDQRTMRRKRLALMRTPSDTMEKDAAEGSTTKKKRQAGSILDPDTSTDESRQGDDSSSTSRSKSGRRLPNESPELRDSLYSGSRSKSPASPSSEAESNSINSQSNCEKDIDEDPKSNWNYQSNESQQKGSYYDIVVADNRRQQPQPDLRLPALRRSLSPVVEEWHSSSNSSHGEFSDHVRYLDPGSLPSNWKPPCASFVSTVFNTCGAMNGYRTESKIAEFEEIAKQSVSDMNMNHRGVKRTNSLEASIESEPYDLKQGHVEGPSSPRSQSSKIKPSSPRSPRRNEEESFWGKLTQDDGDDADTVGAMSILSNLSTEFRGFTDEFRGFTEEFRNFAESTREDIQSRLIDSENQERVLDEWKYFLESIPQNLPADAAEFLKELQLMDSFGGTNDKDNEKEDTPIDDQALKSVRSGDAEEPQESEEKQPEPAPSIFTSVIKNSSRRQMMMDLQRSRMKSRATRTSQPSAEPIKDGTKDTAKLRSLYVQLHDSIHADRTALAAQESKPASESTTDELISPTKTPSIKAGEEKDSSVADSRDESLNNSRARSSVRDERVTSRDQADEKDLKPKYQARKTLSAAATSHLVKTDPPPKKVVETVADEAFDSDEDYADPSISSVKQNENNAEITAKATPKPTESIPPEMATMLRSPGPVHRSLSETPRISDSTGEAARDDSTPPKSDNAQLDLSDQETPEEPQVNEQAPVDKEVSNPAIAAGVSYAEDLASTTEIIASVIADYTEPCGAELNNSMDDPVTMTKEGSSRHDLRNLTDMSSETGDESGAESPVNESPTVAIPTEDQADGDMPVRVEKHLHIPSMSFEPSSFAQEPSFEDPEEEMMAMGARTKARQTFHEDLTEKYGTATRLQEKMIHQMEPMEAIASLLPYRMATGMPLPVDESLGPSPSLPEVSTFEPNDDIPFDRDDEDPIFQDDDESEGEDPFNGLKLVSIKAIDSDDGQAREIDSSQTFESSCSTEVTDATKEETTKPSRVGFVKSLLMIAIAYFALVSLPAFKTDKNGGTSGNSSTIPARPRGKLPTNQQGVAQLPTFVASQAPPRAAPSDTEVTTKVKSNVSLDLTDSITTTLVMKPQTTTFKIGYDKELETFFGGPIDEDVEQGEWNQSDWVKELADALTGNA